MDWITLRVIVEYIMTRPVFTDEHFNNPSYVSAEPTYIVAAEIEHEMIEFQAATGVKPGISQRVLEGYQYVQNGTPASVVRSALERWPNLREWLLPNTPKMDVPLRLGRLCIDRELDEPVIDAGILALCEERTMSPGSPYLRNDNHFLFPKTGSTIDYLGRAIVDTCSQGAYAEDSIQFTLAGNVVVQGVVLSSINEYGGLRLREIVARPCLDPSPPEVV